MGSSPILWCDDDDGSRERRSLCLWCRAREPAYVWNKNGVYIYIYIYIMCVWCVWWWWRWWWCVCVCACVWCTRLCAPPTTTMMMMTISFPPPHLRVLRPARRTWWNEITAPTRRSIPVRAYVSAVPEHSAYAQRTLPSCTQRRTHAYTRHNETRVISYESPDLCATSRDNRARGSGGAGGGGGGGGRGWGGEERKIIRLEWEENARVRCSSSRLFCFLSSGDREGRPVFTRYCYRDARIRSHPKYVAQSNDDDDTTAVTCVYVSTLRPFWLSVRTCISADLKLAPLFEESLPRPSRRLQSPSRKYSHRLPNWMLARQLDSGIRWGYGMGCLCTRVTLPYRL